MNPHWLIRLDDLRGPDIQALLEEHLADMRSWSPACSVHALDLERLREPDIRFWTIWQDSDLLGCGALKILNPSHAEIKSMRTARAHRHQGVGRAMLTHLLQFATSVGIQRLSLETGSFPQFEPARQLYTVHGFSPCEPFADYKPDPNSFYMTRLL